MADVLALGSIRILFIRQALMIRHVLLLLTLFIPACRSGAPVANDSPLNFVSKPVVKSSSTVDTSVCRTVPTEIVQAASAVSLSIDPSRTNASNQAPVVQSADFLTLDTISNEILTEGQTLSIDQVVALALANNPTIPQARSLVQQQNGVTVQAGLYPNPQIGYLRSDPDKSDKSRSSGAFLSQEFVTAGKLRLAQLASRYDVTLRAWQVTAQEQRVINDVRIRFIDLIAAQEAVSLSEEMAKSAAEGVKIANAMREGSVGTKPDVLLAEMQLSTAQGANYDANLRLEAARHSLESIVGTSIGSLKAKYDFEEETPSLDWDQCLLTLHRESPLLKSQAAELEAARTEIRLSDAQAIPNITAQMVAQRDSTDKYSSIGTFVAIPAPIFNRNQGNRISARAFYAQQLREYERLKLALADQLALALRQYKSLQHESKRIESDVLPRATQNLELTSDAFKSGRMDFQRVIDARRLLFQSKLARIESLSELHKTLVEIDGLQLTGGLNPTEVGTALQSSATSSGNGARSILSQQLQGAQGSTTRNLPGAIQAGDF